MENYEINDVVENVVETGSELMPEVADESNGLVKALYVVGGMLIGGGLTALIGWGKKKMNDRKAKKKAEEKDITEIEIEEIPGEETKK